MAGTERLLPPSVDDPDFAFTSLDTFFDEFQEYQRQTIAIGHSSDKRKRELRNALRDGVASLKAGELTPEKQVEVARNIGLQAYCLAFKGQLQQQIATITDAGTKEKLTDLFISVASAKFDYYNELNVMFDDSFDYQHHGDIHSVHSLPFDDYKPGSESSLLIGGVVGGSAVVIIMLIFCLGLAFGMIIYWGYSQKRALDVKRKKEEMGWIDDEERNEV
eukprot:305491_1